MAAQTTSLIILLIISSDVSSDSPAVIETRSLAATEGSCVEIKCQITGYLVDEDALWFWMKDGKWDYNINDYSGTIVYSNKITERPISSEFEGRVNYTGSQRLAHRSSSSSSPLCSILICNLKIEDSGKYFFRYVPADPTEKWRTRETARLTVQENSCPITFNKPAAVMESSTVKLQCSTKWSCYSYIEIVPKPGFNTLNSNPGWNGATLSFSASWQDDGREFTCQTVRNPDKYLAKKITVRVNYAPRDTEAVISSDGVTEGASLTLTCSAKGQPAPTFSWYKNHETKPHYHHTGAEWNINSVQIEHTGEYFCTAQNKHGIEKSNIVPIDVKYAPSVKVKVSSSQPSYKQGETVTLTCEVVRSNPPPYLYTWYLNGTRITSGQTYVKSLQPEDSGSYTCSATNTVAVGYSSPQQINVHYKPRNTNIEIVGPSDSVAVGHSVLFKCTTKANPAAGRYYWRRHSYQRQLNPSQWTTYENSLEIKSVQRADEACYSCSAENSIGAGDSSRRLCMKVIYPPTRLTLSMDTEVTEGQEITITCTVDSEPKSTLTLSTNAEMNPPGLQKVTYDNTLYYSFSVSSAHAGVYTCHAQNTLGSNSTQRQLWVKYSPKNVKVQADPGLAVKENMTLKLSCSAQSYPPVTSVTWTNVIGQNRTKHTGSTFTVNSVTPNDSGLYSCTAHNDMGKGQSQPVEVKVKFAPKQMKVLRAVEAQMPSGTRSVTLSCSSHSYPPVSKYTWYRRTDHEDVKVSENINYTVLSTQPGVYYCTARNEISERMSEPVRLFLDGGYMKFIFLALVPLLIVLVAVFVFRLKRKKSTEEGSENSSLWWSCSSFMGGWTGARGRTEPGRTEPCRGRDKPDLQQRPDITCGTSTTTVVYSTVNLPKDKQGRGGTRGQHGPDSSLNYASIHFKKKEASMPPKPKEDVVYSTVKTTKEEMADVYENLSTVQKYPKLELSDTDSSEDEVDVSYTQVTFRNKAQCREAPRLSAEEEAQYSELKF